MTRHTRARHERGHAERVCVCRQDAWRRRARGPVRGSLLFTILCTVCMLQTPHARAETGRERERMTSIRPPALAASMHHAQGSSHGQQLESTSLVLELDDSSRAEAWHRPIVYWHDLARRCRRSSEQLAPRDMLLARAEVVWRRPLDRELEGDGGAISRASRREYERYELSNAPEIVLSRPEAAEISG